MRDDFQLSQPGLAIFVRSGSEGPRHDPYGWEEFEVHRNGRRVSVREGGLGYTRLTVDDVTCESDPSQDAVDAWFQLFTGRTATAWRKAAAKAARNRTSRCRCCGGRRFETMSGFPGESFTVCATCKEVVSTSMNWSAIE